MFHKVGREEVSELLRLGHSTFERRGTFAKITRMRVDMKDFWIDFHDFQQMMSVLFSQPLYIDYKIKNLT